MCTIGTWRLETVTSVACSSLRVVSRAAQHWRRRRSEPLPPPHCSCAVYFTGSGDGNSSESWQWCLPSYQFTEQRYSRTSPQSWAYVHFCPYLLHFSSSAGKLWYIGCSQRSVCIQKLPVILPSESQCLQEPVSCFPRALSDLGEICTKYCWGFVRFLRVAVGMPCLLLGANGIRLTRYCETYDISDLKNALLREAVHKPRCFLCDVLFTVAVSC